MKPGMLAKLGKDGLCHTSLNEVTEWSALKTLHETWTKCERGEWLVPFLAYMSDSPGWPDKRTILTYLCEFISPMLSYLPLESQQPRAAIETVRKWLGGEIDKQELKRESDDIRALARGLLISEETKHTAETAVWQAVSAIVRSATRWSEHGKHATLISIVFYWSIAAKSRHTGVPLREVSREVASEVHSKFPMVPDE